MSTPENLESTLSRLVERVESRYFGKYRGVVTDNQDPDSLGRLRARVPRLLGDVEVGWALPAAPYGGASDQGLFTVPDVGASVWIEFEAGELAYPVWTGTWWGDGEIPESATPDQKVLKTASGHKIVLDDSADRVAINDSNGNAVTLDASGITLSDANGNSITMDASGVTIKGSLINIGDPAVDNLVAFNMLSTALMQFAALVQTHTHVSGPPGSPTGPPVPPPTLTLDPAKSKHMLEI